MRGGQQKFFNLCEPSETVFERHGARCRRWRAFLPSEDADGLLDRLLRSPQWEQERPLVGGVERPSRRSSIAYGAPGGLVYRYAGIERRAAPFPSRLWSVLASIQVAWGDCIDFNFCLANLYPDGRAALGWHSDQDGGGLVPGYPIVSLSLGARRRFCVLDKETQKTVLDVELEHGDLLSMEGKHFQSLYLHRVPPSNAATPRVSLTFRQVERGR